MLYRISKTVATLSSSLTTRKWLNLKAKEPSSSIPTLKGDANQSLFTLC